MANETREMVRHWLDLHRGDAEAESRLRAQKLDREHRRFVQAVSDVVCDVVEAGADPAEGMRKLYELMGDM